MVDAPELTSMTRRRAVRPLLVAWIFIFVMLGTGFAWLSLSPDEDIKSEDHAAEATEDSHNTASAEQHTVKSQDSESPSNDTLADNGHGAANQKEEPSHDISPNPVADHADDDKVPENRLSLTKAPIDGLTVQGSHGPLPVLGPDSMVAWKEYARPFKTEKINGKEKPQIAIIVTGIGLNAKITNMAITSLPGEINLGFSPYGRKLQKWMNKSRDYGHESLLMIPTEPLKYPDDDPGPHTLMTGASSRDNLKRLDWVLSQVTGYVGVINEMGSKFTTSEDDVLPILESLKGRGLMFLDSRSTRFSVAAKVARRLSMPRALNNLYIDNNINSKDIRANLAQLENTARTYGTALGVANTVPLSIKEIALWSKSLSARGFQLVPVTAIANRQPIR